MTDDYYLGTWRLNGRYFSTFNAAMIWLRSQGWEDSDAQKYLKMLSRQWR